MLTLTYDLKEEAAFIIDLSSGRHYAINKKGDMIAKSGNMIKLISDYSDIIWMIPISKIEAIDVKSSNSLERNKMCDFVRKIFE